MALMVDIRSVMSGHPGALLATISSFKKENPQRSETTKICDFPLNIQCLTLIFNVQYYQAQL